MLTSRNRNYTSKCKSRCWTDDHSSNKAKKLRIVSLKILLKRKIWKRNWCFMKATVQL